MTLAEKQSSMARRVKAYEKGAKLPVYDGRVQAPSRSETDERVARLVTLAERVKK